MTSKERYEYLKAHQRCVSCGNQDAYTLIGKARCFECTQKINAYCHGRKQDYSRQKAQREERRKQNRCVKCGRELPDNDYLQCEYCRAKDRIIHQKNLHGKHIEMTLRGQDGMCFTCRKNPVKLDYKICEECYQKNLKSLVIARASRNILNNWLAKENTLYFLKRSEGQ